MSKLAETPDEAVKRIAKQNHLVHFVQGEDGYGGEDEVDTNAEAAIRQGIAWAYRDAAREVRDFSWVLPMYESAEVNGASDDAACAANQQAADALERKAEEVTRG